MLHSAGAFRDLPDTASVFDGSQISTDLRTSILLTLRCTKKLLKKLGLPETTGVASTTALGDWYATILIVRPKHLLLCVSENSRLAVILPSAPLATLEPRFRQAVRDVLNGLKVPEAAVTRELEEMETLLVGPTQNRSVLGTMNEYVKMIEYKEYDGLEVTDTESALVLNLSLSRTLFSPLNWRYPEDVTRDLLESRWS
jgi:hypothetical protein